jgi:hypothetical protein
MKLDEENGFFLKAFALVFFYLFNKRVVLCLVLKRWSQNFTIK